MNSIRVFIFASQRLFAQGVQSLISGRPGIEVVGVATHSETGERLVVYRPCYGARGLWVRPLAMFVEAVDVEGVSRPRFEPVDEPVEPGS